MSENIFMPPSLELLIDSVLLRTLREYQRVYEAVPMHGIRGASRLHEDLASAICFLMDELAGRGYDLRELESADTCRELPAQVRSRFKSMTRSFA